LPERIEFGLIRRRLDREIPADIDAEEAVIGLPPVPESASPSLAPGEAS
jgi:hypothetical protein